MFSKKETVILTVEGMMCGHCKMRVEDAARSVKGVKKAEADIDKKTVTVTFTDKTNTDTIISAIKEAGFEAVVK